MTRLGSAPAEGLVHAPSGDTGTATPTGITRIAAYCIVEDGTGRLLLCRLSLSELDVGSWTLPGGGVEFGEDPAHAALRELEEETGLGGRITRLLGVDSAVYPPRAERDQPLHGIRIIYLAEATSTDELRHEVGGSTDRADWFTREQLTTLPIVDLVSSALAMLAEAAD